MLKAFYYKYISIFFNLNQRKTEKGKLKMPPATKICFPFSLIHLSRQQDEMVNINAHVHVRRRPLLSADAIVGNRPRFLRFYPYF